MGHNRRSRPQGIANMFIYGIFFLLASAVSQQIRHQEHCCDEKLVIGGGQEERFTLIEYTDLNMLPHSCRSGCVYAKKGGNPQKRYCFTDSIDYHAKCMLEEVCHIIFELGARGKLHWSPS